jgi:HlyD family secretion protein
VLFRIARGGLVEVNAEISEQSLGLARPGQTAEVTLPGGRTVAGTVRLVGAEIDSQTRLGRARIALPMREDVRVGGFATVVIKPAAKPVPAVRETAVSYGAEGASLMTISQDNIVAITPVKTGRRGGGYVELVEGPEPGTRVLLGAQNFVLAGDKVQPVPADQAAAPVAASAAKPAAAPAAATR